MQTEKENYNFENQTISSDTINIREELSKYLIHWRLFVLFSIVSIVFAFLYLRYTAPIFRASATIMIKDNNQSGISTPQGFLYFDDRYGRQLNSYDHLFL